MAFCSKCGAAQNEGTTFCANCGTRLDQPAQQPYNQPYQQFYPQQVVYVKPKVPGKGFGISGMVLGIVGLFYSFYFMMGFSILVDMYLRAHSHIESFTEIQGGFNASIIINLIIFTSISLMGIIFGSAAKKRGYKNGISTSGVVLGVIGSIIYLILFIMVVIIMV